MSGLNKKLNVGIVGFGGMGILHLNNYKLIENVNVVSVCDKSKKGIQRASEYGLRVYDNLSDMMANEDIDVIDVCTPTYSHYKNVIEALGNKKNVICEKPIALSYEEAYKMVETAETNGVGLFIGQVLQYSKPVSILKSIIKNNTYGKVLDCYFYRLSSKPNWSDDSWMLDPGKSGLIPFDLHIHDLDLLVSLFGEPNDVVYSAIFREKSKQSEHYRFKYLYDSFEAVVEAAWYEVSYPFTSGFRIYFEDALLVLEGDVLKAYTKEKEPTEFDITESILVESGINIPPTQIFHDELSDFINRINSGYQGCYRKETILKVIKILSNIKTQKR